MPTNVVYYDTPLNIDYLIAGVRLNFGDLEGTIFSDTTIRTGIVNAVKYLQRKWGSKYQVYDAMLLVSPQPDGVPVGYVLANTFDGQAYIPSGLNSGDIFRNPYVSFNAPAPVITSEDETAIVLAATYLLRKAQVSSSSDELVSWSTEDIRYTNLSKERSVSKLLEEDTKALEDYFRRKLARPIRVEYPIGYIPGYHDIDYTNNISY